MKRRAVVTGGAGFIGSHVADSFIAAGFDLLIIDDLSTGKMENVNRRAAFVEADIMSEECLDAIIAFKPEIISHHAAQIDVRKSVEDPIFDARTNICGTINLLNAADSIKIKKFIFASTGGAIYGEQQKFPADEEHPKIPESPYGIAKLACEHYIRYFAAMYHFESVILRYGNVYGPRQNPHGEAGVVAIFMDRLINRNPAIINGDGEQTRDYVYVMDIVRANMLAVSDTVSGVYNVGTGKESSVNEIYQQITKSLNLSVKEKHGAAKLGEQRRSVIDYKKIEKRLGWKPEYNLERGMNETADFFKSMHK